MKYTVIYILVFITVFCSCGRRPRHVIPEDKMMNILYDIRLVQAIYSSDPNFYADKKKDAMVEGVLDKYGITQAELDSSLVWYADNIESYRQINDSVSSRLRARSNFIAEQKNKMESKSYKTDYIIPPFYYLNEFTPTLAFSIDSFKLKTMHISSFHLTFDVQGLNPLQKADAAIYFTYKDTLVYNTLDIDKNLGYTFVKPQLPDSLLKGISGYVRINNKPGIPSNVLLYNISYSDSVAVNNPQFLPSESTPVKAGPVRTDRTQPMKPRIDQPVEMSPVTPVKEDK